MGARSTELPLRFFFPKRQEVFLLNWRGMYAKYLKGKNVAFIDTKKLPIIKEKVRKLEDQKEYESHCLWKDVTFNLKIRDIDAASEAKHRLEEWQSKSLRKEGKGNSMGDKVVSWRWRMLGFWWTITENVLVLPSIRLGNTKFAPGSRTGGIITQQSSFGRTDSLSSYCSGSCLRDIGLSEADEQLKWAKLPFFLSVAVTMLILVLRKTSGLENKMSAPFPNPMM